MGRAGNIIFACLILVGSLMHGQIKDIGLPFIDNYSREEYTAGTQNWAITQDDEALMYFGNNNGVMRYDGRNWEVFSLPNNPIVRSVNWIDGKLFVGGYEEFGYFKAKEKEFFLLLNLAVGGNWPGYPDATTVFSQRLYVDYIRVYQLDNQPVIAGDSLVPAWEKNVVFSTVESEDFTYGWIVPEGALISGDADSSAIRVDWACDTGTVSCHLTTECDSYDLKMK